MKVRPWKLPEYYDAQLQQGCIKNFPPGGSGHHLPPEARESMERAWLQGVRNSIGRHHSTDWQVRYAT
eukprot:15203446-Heterocapsa_arctica.AAC.1